MKNVALASLVFSALSLVACGGVDDGSLPGAGQADETADELRTAGIKSIVVTRGQGFMPPPMRGRCHPSGLWAFDFASRELTGDACVGSVPVPVQRTLSAEDAADVKKAVSAVRVTARPGACPTDVPTNSLTVKRAQSETHYVDARSACGGGATPVKEASLRALVELLEGFSTPATQPPAAEVFEGTLSPRMFAIGGETTGRLLQTSSGTFELVFEGNESDGYVAGRKARVTGTRRDAPGVEIAMRHYIDVEDLLVCPAAGATVNCMPPTTSKVCKNSAWIEDNCGGVLITH